MRRVILIVTGISLLCAFYLALVARDMVYIGTVAPIFRFLLARLDGQAVWVSLLICLIALLWRRAAPVLRLANLLGRYPSSVATGCVLFVSAGTVLIYHNHPFSMDEYAAVFQSKVFASGHLAAHLPPALVDWLVVPGFNGPFLIASRLTGFAVESYWPGYALLLTPFTLLGVPWLCNALLAGLALWLIHRITLELTDDRAAAGWALLFALGSGAFLANAISYYSMQAHLTANLLFAWLLLRPSNARAAMAGLVGSLALVLHNPFPHVMFALPWMVGLAIDRGQRRYLLPLLLSYLPLAVVLGAGWLLLRGGIAPPAAHSSTLGGILHGAFQVPDGSSLPTRVAGTVKLWVWAVPGLLAFATLGARRHWADRRIRLLCASALLTYCGYFFVTFDQGHGWGYRYFHSAWGVLPILAGCALAGATIQQRLLAYAGALAALSLALLVPLQLWQMNAIIGLQLQQLQPPMRPGNNVYFLDGMRGFYVLDMVQIDPQLRGQDLILASRGEAVDTALIQLNWPDAVRVSRSNQAVQWNLGATERRTSTPEQQALHFSLATAPSGSGN